MADNLVNFLEALTLKEMDAESLEDAAKKFYEMIILDVIRRSGRKIYFEPRQEIDSATRPLYHLSYEIYYGEEELRSLRRFGNYKNGKFLVAKPPEDLTLKMIEHIKEKIEKSDPKEKNQFIHVYVKYGSAILWGATLEQKDQKPYLVLEKILRSTFPS